MGNADVRRLTRAQRNALRIQLERWQTPAVMLATVSAVHPEIMFRQAGMEYLREAWTGATLGSFLRAHEVRLVAAQRPDFELRLGSNVCAFEVTEVMPPDRKRGMEDITDAATYDGTADDWYAESLATPGWLGKACLEKAGKGYSSDTSLAVYLNAGGKYGSGVEVVRDAMVSSTRPAKDAFAQVWVLWQGRSYLCWDAGKPQTFSRID